ncbi:PREDICTED: ER membrane protein complex subunit 7 homolog [Fragaria vesca subsp. vesca]
MVKEDMLKLWFLKKGLGVKGHNVPLGTHLIEVSAIDYFFSPVRVDVSARNPGKVQAALTENRRGLLEFVLEPLKEEQYYEIREPFNIMSIVKSPMGLMVRFMVVVVFLMPKLMETIDPKEMRRTQEAMGNGGLASMLPSGCAWSLYILKVGCEDDVGTTKVLEIGSVGCEDE